MTAPPPGIIPMKNPMTEPRKIAHLESDQSLRVGKTFPIFVVMISVFNVDSRL